MIELSALRLDDGEFRYAIDADGGRLVVTTTTTVAFDVLRELGVEMPNRLVLHAQQWGSVRIAERRSRRMRQ